MESEDSAQSCSRAQSSTCPVPKSRSVACHAKFEPCWWRGKERDSTPGQASASAHSTGVRAEGSHPGSCHPFAPSPELQPSAGLGALSLCGDSSDSKQCRAPVPQQLLQQSLSLPQHLRMKQGSRWVGGCTFFPMRCGTEEHCRPAPTMAAGPEVSQGPMGCQAQLKKYVESITCFRLNSPEGSKGEVRE